MFPLGICSIVAITVIIERFFFFRRIQATALAEKVLKMVEGQHMDEAQAIAGQSSLPLIKVLAAGINNRLHPAKAMEAAGITEMSAMRRGLPVLDTIVTLSPLLGLLGTIIGMINSFQIMAVSGIGQPHAVTGGVAEALIATATGITVAVIALIPYNYFLARIERETEKIEHYATRLEIALTTPPVKE
ncbi:Biopolymer transport protein ExbB [Sporomusa acidovorans DSM 3132]|uniref:Biopolymer transport protein ExbB n=2 Tax=Sporomusa TaxID=2375 RepID=A0ABZ3JA73_SPOA4|nr:biopolymer transport protein ExbB [Sporomusa acidovorans DSM 3132]SDD58659.1 outer membrane transport energization protein ExbB [Sporomusa acidovorans]